MLNFQNRILFNFLSFHFLSLCLDQIIFFLLLFLITLMGLVFAALLLFSQLFFILSSLLFIVLHSSQFLLSLFLPQLSRGSFCSFAALLSSSSLVLLQYPHEFGSSILPFSLSLFTPTIFVQSPSRGSYSQLRCSSLKPPTLFTHLSRSVTIFNTSIFFPFTPTGFFFAASLLFFNTPFFSFNHTYGLRPSSPSFSPFFFFVFVFPFFFFFFFFFSDHPHGLLIRSFAALL